MEGRYNGVSFVLLVLGVFILRGLFSEFYCTICRKYVHSDWLLDVSFGMLNTVFMSPLSHWHNKNYLMIVSGHLPPQCSIGLLF